MTIPSERLLHFIWQFQYFNRNELTTTAGEAVQIYYAGHYNTHQGPDFQNAKIRIQKTTWAGHVELHIKTSDWKKHKHQGDKNYDNVILHVVWEHDTRPGTGPGEFSNNLPVLELKGRVPKMLLQRYEELMHHSSFLPCERLIGTVKAITWRSWKDRLLAERLQRKAAIAEQYLQENNYHWEETFWWLLARNFGAKVNAAAFEAMARSIPVNILAKHKAQLQQLEALLFGQAGLLKEKRNDDEYYNLLQREYRFLQQKYKLQPIHQPVHFLRMRPGNFPTIRLAQLAVLVQNSVHLFSKIKETVKAKDVKAFLDVTANDYWHYHYRFGETTVFKKKNLGADMADNILINTIAPVLFAYGSYHHEDKYKDKALQWLEKTAAESNSITKRFEQLGIENKNAFDSQALIELKNEYCSKLRCLECGVGNALLKQ
jgi:hypothetical protein